MAALYSFVCWRTHDPQNTPRTAQLFSSTRLSGSFGISPAANPTTRWRPSQASETQRRLAVAAAHWIEHDVDAVLAAKSLERGAQILPFIVHQLMRPVCADEGELVVGRRAGNHARAHLAANLDSGKPDAAGSPEHGQGLPRAHQRPVLERMVSRAIGDGQRRGAIEIEIGRQLDDVVGGDRRSFARGVKIGVAHDAVAGLECINSRADAFDHARELAARRERKGWLGLVLAG